MLLSGVLPVVLPRKLPLMGADVVEMEEDTAMVQNRCMTQPVQTVAKLAKFLSAQLWVRTENQFAQSIVVTVTLK
jgi:hypothetical protein